jgi:tetratricopeptide (TPR) repeat protein
VRTLWIDVNNLLALTRHAYIGRFDLRQPGQRTSQQVRYTAKELHRLRVLACVVVGIVHQRACVANKAASEIDDDLRRLARFAEAAYQQGDPNYVLRRGALLHTDVAMRTAAVMEPIGATGEAGPKRLRVTIGDGLGKDLGQNAVHWEIARMLLDRVRPAGSEKPDPARDEMVRQWYCATSAWMQSRESYETDHLDRALEIFPADPDILFLAGTLHESYAAARIQAAIRSVTLPDGVSFALGSDHAELRKAEGLLRRVVAAKPDFSEARVRLGHVLLRLGKPADAAKELTQAIDTIDDPLLGYYAGLFSGAAREALGDLAAAEASYLRAAELQPRAQSTHFALSALARRRGDRNGALREMRRVFELASDDLDDDPWWTYHTAQARSADDLFTALVAPFRSGADR